MPIKFNNPLKACFSNKKSPITVQTRPTEIVKVYFLLKPVIFCGFLRFINIGAQNQFLFGSNLVLQASKARNSTPTHTNFYPLISYSLKHIKSEQKVIQK